MGYPEPQAGGIALPFPGEDRDRIVQNGRPGPSAGTKLGSEGGWEVTASPERQRAALRGARIDLNEVQSAGRVAKKIEAMDAGKLVVPRDLTRSRFHFRTIDASDDIRRANFALCHEYVIKDRPDNLALPAREGARRRPPDNILLRAHDRSFGRHCVIQKMRGLPANGPYQRA
jgi:hypothetical protein